VKKYYSQKVAVEKKAFDYKKDEIASERDVAIEATHNGRDSQ
jgi:hypothetical protein